MKERWKPIRSISIIQSGTLLNNKKFTDQQVLKLRTGFMWKANYETTNLSSPQERGSLKVFFPFDNIAWIKYEEIKTT